MKVPTHLGNPFQINGEKSLAFVQDAIILAAKQLQFEITDITVTFPPLIDDFDMIKAKVYWRAKIAGLPPEFKGNPAIAGRLAWPEMPDNEQLQVSVVRSVSFALLIGVLPERGFIYSAIDAFKYNQKFLMIGVYLQECVHYMDNTISKAIMAAGSEEDRKKLKVPSVASVRKIMGESVERQTIDFLKNVHDKMQKDLDRE